MNFWPRVTGRSLEQVEQNRCKDKASRKAVTLGSARTGVLAHVHPKMSISQSWFLTVPDYRRLISA